MIFEFLICLLDDRTPLVRWWHRRFGHGKISRLGECWACGQAEDTSYRQQLNEAGNHYELGRG